MEKINLSVSSRRGLKTAKTGLSFLRFIARAPNKEKTVFLKRANQTRQLAFRNRVKTLAKALGEPRLKKIHYHTMRHCKALREYHKTQNILHVKKVLGHKCITTTQRYVELYEELYDSTPRETVCEIALNIQEAKRLMDEGFRYETGEYSDCGKLFYKYK